MTASFTKRLKWNLEAGMHSGIALLLRPFSPIAVFKTGEFLGKIIWPLIKKRQRIIERNLRIAIGEDISIPEARALGKKSFIRTVANLLSSTFTKELSDESLEEMLKVENPELLHEAYSHGNGVILLLAHMGNWELLPRVNHFFPKGSKSGAFYRPLNNPVLDARIRKQREEQGTEVFSKHDSLHKVTAYLREGAIIGLLADQRVGMQGEVIEFFGRITRASPLPSLLVRRCKSEVLSLSLKTVAPGKWIAKFHRVEKPYNTTNCMASLQASMLSSMEDVFWLQERWKTYIGPTLTPIQWLKKENIRGQKKHRALVWTTSAEKNLPLPEGFAHGDIDYEYFTDQNPENLPEIDTQKQLPIDFILAFSKSDSLKEEASKLGIPLIIA